MPEIASYFSEKALVIRKKAVIMIKIIYTIRLPDG